MIDAKTTGKIIKIKRKERSLTQLQLAELLNISNRTVSKWENGDGFPDITILPDIAKELGITIDELLTGEKPSPIIEIKEVPITINNSYKKSRSKFLIFEIIAFCLSIGANIIGGTTELMFFRLRPFYAFIEIYLMVATIIFLMAAIIIFFIGFVKFKSDNDRIKPLILIDIYIFTLITSITPALTIFRILSRLFTDTGYFLRYLFLVIYIALIIIFTIITIRKFRSAKNENQNI